MHGFMFSSAMKVTEMKWSLYLLQGTHLIEVMFFYNRVGSEKYS